MKDCAICGAELRMYEQDGCGSRANGDLVSEEALYCARRAKERALAEVERLTRELAEATKPRWEGRFLCAVKAIAHIGPTEDYRWTAFLCVEDANAPLTPIVDCGTETEAKAAAELACGVEAKDG